MKPTTFIAATLSIAFSLTACKSDVDTNPPPPGSVGALSQSKECRELKRRILMGQSNLNGSHAWEKNTQLQELQNDYHAADCE